ELPADAPGHQRALWAELRQMPSAFLTTARNAAEEAEADEMLSEKGRAVLRQNAARPFGERVAAIDALLQTEERALEGQLFAIARAAGRVEGDPAFVARHQFLYARVLDLGDVHRLKIARRAATAKDREVLLALFHAPEVIG